MPARPNYYNRISLFGQEAEQEKNNESKIKRTYTGYLDPKYDL